MATIPVLTQEKCIYHLGWTGVRDSASFTSTLQRTDFSDTDVAAIESAVAALDSYDTALVSGPANAQATRIGTLSLDWRSQRSLTLEEADRQLHLLSNLTAVRILRNKYLRPAVQEY